MVKRLNPEFVLAFLVASVFWAAVLGWQASYSPSEKRKQECYEAAKKTGHKTDECKSFWERTTSDPVALFTLVLAFTTLGLWTATIGLYFAGRNAVNETRRIGEAQTRAYVSIKSAGIDFVLEMSVPRVSFVASNSGQSPARNFIWNVTLQYADPSINLETVFYEKWLTSTGMDIPAISDAHPEGALVPMPARTHIENVVPGMLVCVIRLKIDFRYTDVFERDWFGEAYFSGIMQRRPTVSAEGFKIAPSAWVAQISPLPRPGDWDEIGKAKKT